MDEGTAELYEKLGRIVRKEGWLWQRGGGLTDWVRRYVKLSGCCILFYERADDVSSEGVLPLHKCSVVIIGETDDGRESVFKLDSELWSTVWFQASSVRILLFVLLIECRMLG